MALSTSSTFIEASFLIFHSPYLRLPEEGLTPHLSQMGGKLKGQEGYIS
jgi:hypothetical protein